MSALTSLLVRDDVVSVRQIEDALARQVLEGGELDTALLELDAAAENALNAYRAASFRLPAVARDEVMSVMEATRSLVTAELARSFRIIPITHDATSLLVATSHPLAEPVRADLATQLGMQIECCIASEVRIEAALELYYGVSPSVRMEKLIKRVDRQSAGALPRVEPIQETPISGLAAELFNEDDDVDERETRAVPSQASMQKVVSMRPDELPVANDRTPLPVSAAAVPPPARRPSRRAVVAAPAPTAAAAKKPQPAPRAWQRDRRAPAIPQGPLTRELAGQLLERADERDAVVEVFFRYARQYFNATALFSLREQLVLGREVHNVPSLNDIRNLSITVVRGSMLDELVRTQLPRVGDLSRKEEDLPLAQALHRVESQPSALLPVAIRRRVVSVIYGDRGGEYFQKTDLAPLIELLPEVSRAFERIIRTRKVLGLKARASSIHSASNELGHAATQLNVALPVADTAPQVEHTDPGKAEALLKSARRALSALGAPRTAPPPPPAAGSAGRAQHVLPDDAHAPDRAPTEQLPAVNAASDTSRTGSSPAREAALRGNGYLSKPPPGAGRYHSHREGEGDEPEVEQPSDTQPLRGARSNRPRASSGRSGPLGYSDPAPDDAKPSVRPSKPPPGTGSYRQQDIAQEVVNLSASSQPAPRSPRPEASRRVSDDGFPAEARTGKVSRRSNKPPSAVAAAAAAMAAADTAVGAGSHASADAAAGGSPPPSADAATQPSADASVGAGAAPPASKPEPTSGAARSDRAQARRSKPSRPIEASVIVDTSAQVRSLVDDLCKCGPDDEGDLVRTLVHAGDDALTQLLARFPGPLWFDRRRPYSRLPFGRDAGPIMRGLAAFGAQALPRMAGLLRATHPDVRYYATLFVSDQVHPELLEAISERLFDDDPQIRLMVRDVLPLYRQLAGFESVLANLRVRAREVRAPLPERLAAIDAIAMLREGSAIPELLELLGHLDRQLSIPAHRALVAICCQDFGNAPRKWRGWYEDNQHRHRVQWLIDALMHGEQSLRSAAGIELQKVTQVYYGYVASAPKRDRERAQKRYQDWWDSEGRKKL